MQEGCLGEKVVINEGNVKRPTELGRRYYPSTGRLGWHEFKRRRSVAA